MIIKYPLVLLLLIPVGIFYWMIKSKSTVHSINFPKAQWMNQLKSNRANKLLNITNWLERLIIVALIIAISQPQIIQSKKHQTKKGIDIIAILDTSGSMNAEDFKPKNRMEIAKETLNTFIRKRQNDRLGLIVFGSDAVTKTPITYDHNIIKYHVNQTTVGEVGEGTAIGLAIATGINRLSDSKSKSKAIILITDGVNNAGQIDPISAAKIAAKKGIKIYSIGIGDKKGAPIPINHPTYGKRYAKHPNGALILTEFDDTVLKQISSITKGIYFNARNTEELKAVYKKIDQLEKTVVETIRNYNVFEIFPYLIGCILIMILIKEGITLKYLIGVKT